MKHSFLCVAIVMAVTSLSTQYAAADLANCDGCIEAVDIADRTITSQKMNRNSIQTPHLRNLAVSTDKIADGAVTAAKLADGAVDVAKLAGYDYRDFAGGSANVDTRIYSISDSSGVCDTETHRITRAPQPDGSTLVTNIRVRHDSVGGAVCSYHVFNFSGDDQGLHLLGRDAYDTTGTILNSSITLTDAVTLRTSSMATGIDIASASVATDTVSSAISFISQKSVVVGIEDVTVPAGVYTGCMKVHELRDSDSIGTFNRVAWYCDGIGMVKRISGSGNRFNNHELTSFTVAP